MNNNQFISLLGFARKSGNLAFGQTTVEKGISTTKVSLVIMAKDLNRTTRERLIRQCEQKEVKYLIIEDKETLSKAIGKNNVGIIGITKKKFSRAILESVDEA